MLSSTRLVYFCSILALPVITSAAAVVHSSASVVPPGTAAGTAPCPFPSLVCAGEPLDSASSNRCLNVSDICDGIKDCGNGQDEENCGARGYLISPNLMSTREMNEDTLIEDVTLQACAKFCSEENRFVCGGFQHNFQSHSCRLLDAKFTRAKIKGSLKSFWITFAKSRNSLDDDIQLKAPPTPSNEDNKKTVDAPKHGVEGGFDAIIVEADLDSSPPESERKRRHLPETTQRKGKTVASCGRRSIEFDPPRTNRLGRVVGGVDAPAGAFPWQVAIKRKDEAQPWCGGAIIESRFILTAAHCVDHFHRKGREFVVVAGEHDIQSGSSNEQVFEVENFVTYPDYRNSKSGDDIALIKLQTIDGKGIQFNDQVQPICLPTSESAYQPGTLCSVSGWGMQKANDKGSVPQVLQVASVPLLAGETCIKEDVYGNFLSSNQFPESMVCAGYLEGKTDACSGDSGGPLACRINGEFQLLGLVSWGDVLPGGCASANKPGVYTKILRFVDWIQEWTKKL